MAWTYCVDGRRYFYRSRKVGGKVIHDYIGTGPEAERIAELDSLRIRENEVKVRARKEVKARENSAEKPLKSVNRQSDLLLAAVLLSTGVYHQHDRGEWRTYKCPHIT